MWSKLFSAGLILFFLHQNAFLVDALNNGLALTPPMGWMSWQRFRCIIDCDLYPDECISEKLFKTAADVIASEGYKDVGYEYVIVDDCWMEDQRDSVTQELVPDRKRFPNGMKALADYIHSKGLKFGIYENYGTATCEDYPGMIDHMELDAQTFAKWDVDYIKIDGCNAETGDYDVGYPEFGRLLNQTGRPMVYSCSWPFYLELQYIMPNYDALKEHCNLWRNWRDIVDSYASLRIVTEYFAVNQSRIQPHAGPGHWNDADMLLIGNYGLSFDQSKTQMAIWAVIASPLLMSNDLVNIRAEMKEILLNKEVIAVSQDRLGIQGIRKRFEDNIETWIRPITPTVNGEHSYAIAWSSKRSDGSPFSISAQIESLELTNADGYRVTDLFHENRCVMDILPKENITVRVNPSGVVFYKFTPKSIADVCNGAIKNQLLTLPTVLFVCILIIINIYKNR